MILRTSVHTHTEGGSGRYGTKIGHISAHVTMHWRVLHSYHKLHSLFCIYVST